MSQKAKIRWLREGEQNSKFFHAMLNHRRCRETINKLELEDGSVVTEMRKIVEEIIGFLPTYIGSRNEKGAVLRTWIGVRFMVEL